MTQFVQSCFAQCPLYPNDISSRLLEGLKIGCTPGMLKLTDTQGGAFLFNYSVIINCTELRHLDVTMPDNKPSNTCFIVSSNTHSDFLVQPGIELPPTVALYNHLG